jgi:hypothetical protein
MTRILRLQSLQPEVDHVALNNLFVSGISSLCPIGPGTDMETFEVK